MRIVKFGLYYLYSLNKFMERFASRTSSFERSYSCSLQTTLAQSPEPRLRPAVLVVLGC